MMNNTTPHHIALIGPGGSGKTLLANILMKELSFKIIQEQFRIAKKIINEDGSHFPSHTAKVEAEQERGIERQVLTEITQLAEDNFISDRSVYDYLLYSHLRGLDISNPISWTAVYIDFWYLRGGGYTRLIYVPPFSNDPPEQDSFRFTNKEFVKRERGLFESVHYALLSHPNILPCLYSTTIKDRVREIVNIVFDPYFDVDPKETHPVIMKAIEEMTKGEEDENTTRGD